MSRGDGGDIGDRDYSYDLAFEVVRDFLERLGERRPKPGELREIRPALEALYRKLIRVRERSGNYGGVDFSPRVWALMKLVGKKPLRARRRMGRAAGLL
jgi:hypothetical protein